MEQTEQHQSRSPKKILMVFERHSGGGVPAAAMQEFELLKENGHEVAHFTLHFNRDFFPDESSCPAKHYFAWPDLFPYPLRFRHLQFLEMLLNKLRGVVYFLDQKNPIKGLILPRRLKTAIWDFQPDIVYFHSTGDFARTSALFTVPRSLNIASVYKVHGSNLLMCPNGYLIKGQDDSGILSCDGICSRERPVGQSSYRYGCFQNPLRHAVLLQDFRTRVQAVAQSIDIITAPSRVLTGLLQASSCLNAKQIMSHYNATRRDLLDTSPDFASPREQTYYLAVGRIDATKGFKPLVQAFSKMPDIQLRIVGDGPQKDELEAYIRKHQLKNIELLGWQSPQVLNHYYEACFAVILPSLWFENASIVLQESAAWGKAIIASHRGGNAEFVVHEQTGLLYEPLDEQQCIATVQRLWNEPVLAGKLGRQAHEKFLREFASDVTYDGLMKVFDAAQSIQQESLKYNLPSRQSS